jgi:hypothetical protein
MFIVAPFATVVPNRAHADARRGRARRVITREREQGEASKERTRFVRSVYAAATCRVELERNVPEPACVH